MTSIPNKCRFSFVWLLSDGEIQLKFRQNGTSMAKANIWSVRKRSHSWKRQNTVKKYCLNLIWSYHLRSYQKCMINGGQFKMHNRQDALHLNQKPLYSLVWHIIWEHISLSKFSRTTTVNQPSTFNDRISMRLRTFRRNSLPK